LLLAFNIFIVFSVLTLSDFRVIICSSLRKRSFEFMTLTKMQTGEIDGSMRIGIWPPERKSALEGASLLYDVPLEKEGVMIDREPESGEPYTEIDCGKLQEVLDEERLVLDCRNLAETIKRVFEDDGSEVEFNPVPQQLEAGQLLFGGVQPVPEEA
jgi:hypothetical protein